MIKGRLGVLYTETAKGRFMIGAGKTAQEDARVRPYAHELYFEELVYMKATPDTTRRFGGALDRPPLEGFYLGPR